VSRGETATALGVLICGKVLAVSVSLNALLKHGKYRHFDGPSRTPARLASGPGLAWQKIVVDDEK
jgi:hypothetical protein